MSTPPRGHLPQAIHGYLIDRLTIDASPDTAADYISYWDASTGKHRRITIDDLGTAASWGGGGGGHTMDAAYDGGTSVTQDAGTVTWTNSTAVPSQTYSLTHVGATAITVSSTATLTGDIVSITSAPTATSSARAVYIDFSDADCDGTPITILNGGSANAIAITQSGGGHGIDIAINSDTAAQAARFSTSIAGTQPVVSIEGGVSTHAGSLLALSHLPVTTATADMMTMVGGANCDGDALSINFAGTGNAINIINAATDSISVAQSDAGAALATTLTHASATILSATSTATLTGDLISITSAPTATSSARAVLVDWSDADCDGDSVSITHGGSAHAIKITKSGASGSAINIDSDSSSGDGIYVQHGGSSAAIRVNIDNTIGTAGITMDSTLALTSSYFRIEHNPSATSSAYGIEIDYNDVDADAPGIYLNHAGDVGSDSGAVHVIASGTGFSGEAAYFAMVNASTTAFAADLNNTGAKLMAYTHLNNGRDVMLDLGCTATESSHLVVFDKSPGSSSAGDTLQVIAGANSTGVAGYFSHAAAEGKAIHVVDGHIYLSTNSTLTFDGTTAAPDGAPATGDGRLWADTSNDTVDPVLVWGTLNDGEVTISASVEEQTHSATLTPSGLTTAVRITTNTSAGVTLNVPTNKFRGQVINITGTSDATKRTFTAGTNVTFYGTVTSTDASKGWWISMHSYDGTNYIAVMVNQA